LLTSTPPSSPSSLPLFSSSPDLTPSLIQYSDVQRKLVDFSKNVLNSVSHLNKARTLLPSHFHFGRILNFGCDAKKKKST
jgi:hypothetical protein